jgi:glycosyltransferase involved in cell wall biosynthesis
MKVSVIINNYNYKEYLADSIESVLSQTRTPDEIIVVDDGSSDGSDVFISEKYGNIDVIKIVKKENGGQLSAINAGFRSSSGDIIFFLDSDDIYENNYIEYATNFYQKNPDCDFTYCGYKQFGKQNSIQVLCEKDLDIGYTASISTIYSYIGGPTSMNSCRRHILEKFLPLPFESEFRVCADDCIVLGASLVGARKYYISGPFVRYRIHDKNNYANNILKRSIFNYKKSFAKERIINYILNNNYISIESLYKNAVGEFRAISRPRTYEEFRKYCKLIGYSNKGFFWNFGRIIKLIKSFFRLRKVI